MIGNLRFPNPATAGADKLGFLVISAAVVFVLAVLFNAHRMGKFRRDKAYHRPRSFREEVLPVIAGILAVVLVITAVRVCLNL